ncbi:DNA/RNA nuclease SfsA [Candidatus Berkiella cookevillensis]|uniref:DNA/RNA nuclease SfsA n=1 Tax=Candidatus Berkiella cookevillensis TaxID=437022 RepID=A0A0Q9YF34_9GAMM|nr:DNA/RNA nuclease SfsA [Candidatus Berkiella cookevillensis]MCS5709442.1 DNA/RNA nuclease SfsA [Candidatus Berkiella cookevillensis]
MKFPSPLQEAILLKRYKRFLADIVLANQEKHTIYCPNAGNLIGCNVLGSRVWFSRCSNPNKTYHDTWELVEIEGGKLVCVNHQRAKQIILDGIATNVIAPLSGYQHVLSDVKFNNQKFDFLLSEYPHFNDKEKLSEAPKHDNCFVVVQSVTMGDEIHRGFYPDTDDKRITKQLSALIAAKELGYRAVWVYCVMNTGINKIFPADHINPDFGCLLRQAVIRGVEVMAYRVHITLEEMVVTEPVEVCIPARMLYTPRSEKSD